MAEIDGYYVYIKSEPQLWTAGFYRPDGTWDAESDHSTPEEAARRVHYLNGGTDTAKSQRIARLEQALRQLANNDLNDGNCASVNVAAKRVRNIARAALKEGE